MGAAGACVRHASRSGATPVENMSAPWRPPPRATRSRPTPRRGGVPGGCPDATPGGCPDATLRLQQLIGRAGPLLADADGGRRDRGWLVLGGLGGAAGPAGVDCVGAGVAEVDSDLGGRLGVDRAGGGEVEAVAGLDGDRLGLVGRV